LHTLAGEPAIGLDMAPGTFGKHRVESAAFISGPNAEVWVNVVCMDAVNLDTYTFRVVYPNQNLECRPASAEDFINERGNFLASRNGSVCCWQAQKYAGATHDTIAIAHSIIGQDSAAAPDGFGLLAALRFKALLSAGQSDSIRIVDAAFVDHNEKRTYPAIGFAGKVYNSDAVALIIQHGENGVTMPADTVLAPRGIAYPCIAAADPGYALKQWETLRGEALIDSASADTCAVTVNSDTAVIKAVFHNPNPITHFSRAAMRGIAVRIFGAGPVQRLWVSGLPALKSGASPHARLYSASGILIRQLSGKRISSGSIDFPLSAPTARAMAPGAYFLDIGFDKNRYLLRFTITR